MCAARRRRQRTLRFLIHSMMAAALLCKRWWMSWVGSRLVRIHTRNEPHQSSFGGGGRPPRRLRGKTNSGPFKADQM
ncbi:hypothetical protein ATANTOWER_014677 [Ataeniobius toweri]|uniref:Secreted protein n=1 Tax=Ataeniobius toweri TaxID=208326 RepID=A0ABU7AF67_9TELE|nr:hypothetical protein [Ataeniobius toweri]